METIFELIVEVILNVLFVLPGAFVRWLFTGFRGTFKSCVDKGDSYPDGVIGLCCTVAIVLLVGALFY